MILERCLKGGHTRRRLHGKHILHLQQRIQGIVVLLIESNLGDAPDDEYAVVHMLEWHCQRAGVRIVDGVTAGPLQFPVLLQQEMLCQLSL